MTRMVFLGLAVSAALLASLSCGGGGGSRDTSLDVSLNAPPVGGFDGFSWGNAAVNFPLPNSLPGVAVGDFGDVEARGFLSFDISLLPPPPAVVRAATLEVEQWQITSNPYPSYGAVVIDHINMGSTYDFLDFDSAALDGAFATVSNSPGLRVIGLDVRSQIGADQVAGRTRSSFRLKFTLPTGVNSNGSNDSADFNDAENHAGAGGIVPKLTIVYSP